MKLCVIYNSLPNYREGIFRLIDEEFNTEWVYGSVLGGIKELNPNVLKGKIVTINNHYFFGDTFYWQQGVLKKIFSNHHTYVMLGEERCLSTWLFLIFSKFFKSKKVYIWTHGQYGRENNIKRYIQRLFYNLADGIFVYGNYSKQIMAKNKIPQDKMHVIHNSLNYKNQLILRNNLYSTNIYTKHFGNNYPVLIMIGRLNLRKKLSLLIEAVNKLQLESESYNIVFIGDGEDKQALELLVKQYNLENQVWFYGACYDEKSNAELIYNSDMCVVPGDIGLTAIHCMMFGVPVISHNKYEYQGPEFESIREGVTGDFFKYDDKESLAETISNWFKSNKDRDQIRKNCYREVDEQWNPYFQMNVIKSVIK